MKPIIIYTMENCPYCIRAKNLLKSRSYPFQEIKLDTNDYAKWKELEMKTGMKTVPQIFIDDQCIGGFTEMDALDRSGKLKELLN